MMTSYKQETVPSRIVAIRRSELSLSQSELATKLGYKNANLLTMIEHSESAVPIDKVSDFAAALDIDSRWFGEQVLRAKHSALAEILLGPRSQDAPA
jgi:ribosome-binding protein aMBF1 (putative translation factor)